MGRNSRTGSTEPSSIRRVGMKTNSVRHSAFRHGAILVMLLAMIQLASADADRVRDDLAVQEHDVVPTGTTIPGSTLAFPLNAGAWHSCRRRLGKKRAAKGKKGSGKSYCLNSRIKNHSRTAQPAPGSRKSFRAVRDKKTNKVEWVECE